MLTSIFNILNTNMVFPLRFLALRSLNTNFQSQKLHTLALVLVFIICLIYQKIIGIFKSRNTVLEMEHSSSCGPNGIKFHGISAENKTLRICQNDSKTLVLFLLVTERCLHKSVGIYTSC